MKKECVLIFDIGKTNKKILLFDRQLKIHLEEEIIFPELPDEDGFPGDDIENLENWILDTSRKYISNKDFNICGINFATYGATLVYLDKNGKRLTPVYNYLKPMPEGIVEKVYAAYSGKAEFCRKTASPALGMLNAGFQALWLKEMKAEVFSKVKSILHFPQYLSYLMTGRESAEHTSIGCHTALWDFDLMQYHAWTDEIKSSLPDPLPVETVFPSKVFEKNVAVGIGIHDSSASLVPYFMSSDDPFILLSTGTWCISMNPFNDEVLTSQELENDCLSYLSIRQKAVKSSRLFSGHIHDVNVKRLSEIFGVSDSTYKKINLDLDLLAAIKKEKPMRVFFKNGVAEDFIDRSLSKSDFSGFTEAYTKLMIDLTDLTIESLRLIIPENDLTKNIYISGGFSKNSIFIHLMREEFPEKNVFTSEVTNATSVGAAMVIWKAIDPSFKFNFDLGLK